MSDWCSHEGTVKHWEKGEKIRDEKNKKGEIVRTWYKYYEICDACLQSINFEPRDE